MENRIAKHKKRRRIQPVAGIRRKIRAGFIILGGMLLFAAMVSYFEFSRLNRTTTELTGISLRDLDLSKRMFEAIQKQDAALFLRIYTPQADTLNADSLFLVNWLGFDTAYSEAEMLGIHPELLERVAAAKNNYYEVLNDPQNNARTDTAWYNHQYKLAYYDLALAVKDFMIDSQNTIDRNTTKIENNTYRAIVPGIITLAIAILIIFVFYVLIDQYYIRPVLKVNQGLNNFLNLKIPYTVQVDARDEVKELSDDISTLINQIKKKEGNTEG